MVEASPFDLAPDPEGDKNALTKALQISKDFALYFVVSEVSRVRPRLMDEIEARLPDKNIQRVHITKETTNLLHAFREQLQNPLPDVVFVSGFENVISAVAQPRSHPLLLNLNATRNNFYSLLPRPVVLWVPPFAIRAIAQAAPDFVSVRSGVYTFALSPEERKQMAEIAAAIGQVEILGFERSERDKSIAQMHFLLTEYCSLPEHERNTLDEAQIRNQLGIAYLSLGQYDEAKQYLTEALTIRRSHLPEGHPDIAISLNNLAGLYESQSQFAEAENFLVESVEISRRVFSVESPNATYSMANLASVYASQGRRSEAEPLLLEALKIQREHLQENIAVIPSTISNLAELYRSLGRFDDAESLYLEVLSIRRRNLPENHPDTANSLNNLAELYKLQGRYAEAELLLEEALVIRRHSLPKNHPHIASSLNSLAGLYSMQERYPNVEPLYREALSILNVSLGSKHPNTKLVYSNLALFLKKMMQHTAHAVHPNGEALSMESLIVALNGKSRSNEQNEKLQYGSQPKRQSRKNKIIFKPLKRIVE